MLPTKHPAEALVISPEALEVANCYLQLQDMDKVADTLDIPRDLVSTYLERREVKAYVDSVFYETGFNNRFKMRAALDAIIAKKFQEMDESELGSGKDIIEILALSHKMSMDYLAKEIERKKLDNASVHTQVNVQLNDAGSNYSNLIERLIRPSIDA